MPVLELPVEGPVRRGDPLRRDAPLRRRGRDAAGDPPHAGPRRPHLHPRGSPSRRGLEGEQELIAEMEEYGTLESPFDPEYLVSVLEEAGFEDVSRYAAVDELLDVSAPRTSSAGRGAPRVPADEHRHRREPRSGGARGRRGASRPASRRRIVEVDGRRRRARPSRSVSRTPAAPSGRRAGGPAPGVGSVTLGPYIARPSGRRIELPRRVSRDRSLRESRPRSSSACPGPP